MIEERSKDIELWRRWKQSRSPMDLENLIQQMSPVIAREVNRWAAVAPRFVLDNEAKKLAIKAFESYDTIHGTLLSTHLVNQLQKLSRTAYSRQSTLSIPEQHRLTYNRYTRAKADLEDQLGFPPTLDHIADHLRLPIPKLTNILANVERRELVESGEGPSFQVAHSDTENIEFAYHQMTPRQKQVFDLRTGMHGSMEVGSDRDILTRLGITQGVLSYELQKIKSLLESTKSMR
jgi:DNA-directed RNA polymerase specialized sigma subunit